jgi:hypothetical protein
METRTKTVAIIMGAVALALVLVMVLAAVGLWVGATMIRRQVVASPAAEAIAGLVGSDWQQANQPYARGFGGPGMMWGNQNWADGASDRGYGPGMMWGEGGWDDMPCGSAQGVPYGPAQDMPCAEGYAGPGMMGGAWNPDGMPCAEGYVAPGSESALLSLVEAEEAVERYVDRLGYDNLHVTEAMEFEHNFYAIVAEEDTGIGAMELLVSNSTGSVGQEPGPNMMWNAKYGMHRGGRMGMMGGYSDGEMTLSPEEAEEVAQGWLDANLAGRTAGEADPFYGYYTLHFLKGGKIEGMLSVHGATGDVWYHSWHGDFVAMIGDHD